MRIKIKLRNILERKAPAFWCDFLSNVISWFNGLQWIRIQRIRKIIKDKPLILAIETISACNARCIFCAYPTMKRKHEVMPMSIFEKIIKEYSQMGGGALSLTPVMGDPLLDPEFLQRFKILESYQNINQISFTTNGIALHKFTDEQVQYILSQIFVIQFSIGGLDEETYQHLYQVDKFQEVMGSVFRVIRLKKDNTLKVHIILAFRTNNSNFEHDYAQKLKELRQQGVWISHIATYNNYGGEIKTEEVRIKKNRISVKKLSCALPLLHAHAYSNGKITNCGCVDANGNGLVIGDDSQETIGQAWGGEKRRRIINSFSQGKPPQLCQDCNAYRSSTFLGADIFRKVGRQNYLPFKFYLNFFGG